MTNLAVKKAHQKRCLTKYIPQQIPADLKLAEKMLRLGNTIVKYSTILVISISISIYPCSIFQLVSIRALRCIGYQKREFLFNGDNKIRLESMQAKPIFEFLERWLADYV